MTTHPEDRAEQTIFDKLELNPSFGNDYKSTVFWAWYDNGKPDAKKLKAMIAPMPNLEGAIPSVETLSKWIKRDFYVQAAKIDVAIVERIQDREVNIKVEMLERHAEAGKKMITWALDYLQDNLNKLSPHSAIRMLVEGIEIERKSRGLPGLLKVIKDSDEELMKQISDLLNEGSVPEVIEGEIIEEYETENK